MTSAIKRVEEIVKNLNERDLRNLLLFEVLPKESKKLGNLLEGLSKEGREFIVCRLMIVFDSKSKRKDSNKEKEATKQ